jgi:serine/threonine protein kinase
VAGSYCNIRGAVLGLSSDGSNGGNGHDGLSLKVTGTDARIGGLAKADTVFASNNGEFGISTYASRTTIFSAVVGVYLNGHQLYSTAAFDKLVGSVSPTRTFDMADKDVPHTSNSKNITQKARNKTTQSNQLGGIRIAASATECQVGSAAAGAGSVVVSGNAVVGIAVFGAQFKMESTFVGTSLNGMVAYPNDCQGTPKGNCHTYGGVFISYEAQYSTIGAIGAAGAVVVSGNGGTGINMFSPDSTLINCFVGVSADGMIAVGNGGYGVKMQGTKSKLGSTALGSRCVVSGNALDGVMLIGIKSTLVQAYVGTDISGMVAIPNRGSGVLVEGDWSSVGSRFTQSTSIISGNMGCGIVVKGINFVIGNTFIGVGADGETAIGNLEDGIRLQFSATNATIGDFRLAPFANPIYNTCANDNELFALFLSTSGFGGGHGCEVVTKYKLCDREDYSATIQWMCPCECTVKPSKESKENLLLTPKTTMASSIADEKSPPCTDDETALSQLLDQVVEQLAVVGATARPANCRAASFAGLCTHNFLGTTVTRICECSCNTADSFDTNVTIIEAGDAEKPCHDSDSVLLSMWNRVGYSQQLSGCNGALTLGICDDAAVHAACMCSCAGTKVLGLSNGQMRAKVVVGGNGQNGVWATAPNLRIRNFFAGVDSKGFGREGLGNRLHGIFLSAAAHHTVVGMWDGKLGTTVISGNHGDGIRNFAPRLSVLNCLIGVSSDGVSPYGNYGHGVNVAAASASGCRIGSKRSDDEVDTGEVSLDSSGGHSQNVRQTLLRAWQKRSVISGNRAGGVYIAASNFRLNQAIVGLDYHGTLKVPNGGHGVELSIEATNAIIGHETDTAGHVNEVRRARRHPSSPSDEEMDLPQRSEHSNGIESPVQVRVKTRSIGKRDEDDPEKCQVLIGGNVGHGILSNSAGKCIIFNVRVGIIHVSNGHSHDVGNELDGVHFGSQSSDCVLRQSAIGCNRRSGVVVAGTNISVAHNIIGIATAEILDSSNMNEVLRGYAIVVANSSPAMTTPSSNVSSGITKPVLTSSSESTGTNTIETEYITLGKRAWEEKLTFGSQPAGNHRYGIWVEDKAVTPTVFSNIVAANGLRAFRSDLGSKVNTMSRDSEYPPLRYPLGFELSQESYPSYRNEWGLSACLRCECSALSGGNAGVKVDCMTDAVLSRGGIGPDRLTEIPRGTSVLMLSGIGLTNFFWKSLANLRESLQALHVADNPQLEVFESLGQAIELWNGTQTPILLDSLSILNVRGTDLSRLRNSSFHPFKQSRLSYVDLSYPSVHPPASVVVSLSGFPNLLGVLWYSTICPPGFFSVSVRVEDHYGVCSRCPAGTTKTVPGGGKDSCIPCTPGFIDLDGDPVTPCTCMPQFNVVSYTRHPLFAQSREEVHAEQTGIYAVGSQYRFGPILEIDTQHHTPGALTYTIEGGPDDFLMNPQSGFIGGTLTERKITSYSMTLYAVDTSDAKAIVETVYMSVRLADVDIPSCGPGGRDCVAGNRIDAILFDNSYECDCGDSTVHFGPNCELAMTLTANSVDGNALSIAITAMCILLLGGLSTCCWRRYNLQRRRKNAVKLVLGVAEGRRGLSSSSRDNSGLLRVAPKSSVFYCIDDTNDDEANILFIAAELGMVDLIPDLIRRGANVRQREKATGHLVHSKVLEAMVKSGESVESVDIGPAVALFIACCELDIAVGKAMTGPLGDEVTDLVRAVLVAVAEREFCSDPQQWTTLHFVVNSCLNKAVTETQALDLTEAVLQTAPSLLNQPDSYGRTALDLALACSGAFALQRELSAVLFGEYQLLLKAGPLHKSATSAVYRCHNLSNLSQDGVSHPIVAVKLMANESSWRCELESRALIDGPSRHTVEVFSAVAILDKKRQFHQPVKTKVPISVLSQSIVQWQRHEETRMLMSTYRYGLVMPLADRSLADIIRSDGILPVREIARQIAICIDTLHSDHRLVHGDIKPSNVVQISDEFKLIDFDMSFPMQESSTSQGNLELSAGVMSGIRNKYKESTAYQSPEIVGWVIYGAGLPFESALAKFRTRAQVDIWGFGATLYELASGTSLFGHAHDRMTAPGQAGALNWAGLSPASLKLIQIAQNRTLHECLPLVNLLHWILDRDPICRPRSMSEVLGHAFFDPVEGTMQKHLFVRHINELLADRSSGRRPCRRVMISYAMPDTEFAINTLAMFLAPEVDGLHIDVLVASSPTTDGTVTSSGYSHAAATPAAARTGAPSRGNPTASGMDEVEVVLAVISDAYCESPECAAELQRAINLGKQVIPLVYQMTSHSWPLTQIGNTLVGESFLDQHGQSSQIHFEGDQPAIQQALEQELVPKLLMGAVDFNAELRRMLAASEILPKHALGWRLPKEVQHNSVTLEEKLGSGAFGEVWRATFVDKDAAGLLRSNIVTVKQACRDRQKTVSSDSDTDQKQHLIREATVMAQVSGHPHLLELLGVITTGNRCMLLLTFCELGALRDLLVSNSVYLVPSGGSDGSVLPITLVQKLTMLREVASGMEHLVSKHFIHRDLATRNVLVSSELICKVADFGFARQLHRFGTSGYEYYWSSLFQATPVRWIAPECLASSKLQSARPKFSEASDSWAFGILIIEMYTNGQLPYTGMDNEMVLSRVSAGYRLPQPSQCPDPVYELAQQCWNTKLSRRIKFSKLLTALKELEERAIWLDHCGIGFVGLRVSEFPPEGESDSSSSSSNEWLDCHRSAAQSASSHTPENRNEPTLWSEISVEGMEHQEVGIADLCVESAGHDNHGSMDSYLETEV